MPAIFNTLDDLAREITEMGNHSPEYWAKQVHRVERSRTVERVPYVVHHATGKVVLHVGCTGNMDRALRHAAARCYGIDRTSSDRPDTWVVDLDRLHAGQTLPALPDVQLIVLGEILEHVSNPGILLEALQTTYPGVPLIITVPNAHTDAGRDWLVKRGRENVHREHVCYYSVTTLTTLVQRARYRVVAHYWYGGAPYTSEGLIVLAAPQKDPR